MKTIKELEKEMRKDCDFLLSLIKYKLKISDDEMKELMIFFDKNYLSNAYKLK